MPVGNGDERDGRVALRLVARQNVVALSFLLCNRAVLSLADVYPCDFAAGVLRAYVSSLGGKRVRDASIYASKKYRSSFYS